MPVLSKGFGVVYLDNAGGTLTDVSGQGATCALSAENAVGSYFVLNSRYQKTLDGGVSWSADLEIIAETGTNGYSLIRDWFLSATGGARTFRFDQPDSTTGSQRYEGEVRLASVNGLLSAQAGAGEPVRLSVRLVGDGPLTASIVA
jgi:hypothetical protein